MTATAVAAAKQLQPISSPQIADIEGRAGCRCVLVVRLSGGIMAAKLTVLIPCKNERRNIRPCIESVRSIADEILDRRLRFDRRHARHRARRVSRNRRRLPDHRARVRATRPTSRTGRFRRPATNGCWWSTPTSACRRSWPTKFARCSPIRPQDIDGYWIGRDNHYPGPSHPPLRLEHRRRVAAVSPRCRATTRRAGSTRKSTSHDRPHPAAQDGVSALHDLEHRRLSQEAEPLRRLGRAQFPRRKGAEDGRLLADDHAGAAAIFAALRAAARASWTASRACKSACSRRSTRS